MGPLLEEVLVAAKALGPHSKLVIEIKTRSCPKLLQQFLEEKPYLNSNVALVMSFDKEDLTSIDIEAPKFLLLNSERVSHDWSLGPNNKIWSPQMKNAEAALEEFVEGLEGVYIEFEPCFLDENEALMRKLCKKYRIGVWNVVPDTEEVWNKLADIGFEYINTDLISET